MARHASGGYPRTIFSYGAPLVTLGEKNILIVEDEPDTAEMFAEMMRIIGYSVIKVNGYFPAIEQLKKGQPSAVVLDIMMPDLSGLEVLRFIREDQDLRQTPVVIVSALGLLSDVRTAFDAGADEYLTKPVSFRELKTAVLKVTQMEDLD
jgi:DNA-binding response OmpR family regulator